MDLDDFEALRADKPRNERRELIGGRVVRMMVGARWEHAGVVGTSPWVWKRVFVAGGRPVGPSPKPSP